MRDFDPGSVLLRNKQLAHRAARLEVRDLNSELATHLEEGWLLKLLAPSSFAIVTRGGETRTLERI